MSSALDLLIAQSVASYTVSESPKASTPKAPKVKAPKAQTVKAAVPSNNTAAPKVGPTSEPLPAPGTIGAEQYLIGMRSAKDRQAETRLIASFIGYDAKLVHGDNLLKASMAAKRAMRPIDASGPSRSEQRSAARSVAGYVAGMPDYHEKRLADLKGRERLAVEAIIENEKAANAAKSPEDKALTMAKADLERGRLAQIRADLDSFA